MIRLSRYYKISWSRLYFKEIKFEELSEYIGNYGAIF